MGDYEIVRPLGAGGMGQVFLAWHVELGVERALKVLSTLGDAEALLRFQQEGEAQARLDHPHVARVHDLGQHAGRLYLALDYLQGGDLADRLREPLPVEETLALMAQLASGVSHAHAHGILHRDLKPANVMFDDAGAAKLVDFGLAKVEGARSLTESGAVLGSPQFMAPEQVDGNPADERTDVYGLGAILYNCLTGRPPVPGGTVMKVLFMVLETEPDRPRASNPDVPPWLEAVCLKALAKAPAQRFESVDAFAQALTSPTVEAGAAAWAKWLGALALLALLLGVALRPRPAEERSSEPAAVVSTAEPTAPPDDAVVAAPTWPNRTFRLPPNRTWETVAFLKTSTVVAWATNGEVWARDLAIGTPPTYVAWVRPEHRPRHVQHLSDGSLMGPDADGTLVHFVDIRRVPRLVALTARYVARSRDHTLILGGVATAQIGRLYPERAKLRWVPTQVPLEMTAGEVIDAVAVGIRYVAVSKHRGDETRGRLTVVERESPDEVVLPFTEAPRDAWLEFLPGSSDLLMGKDGILWRLPAKSRFKDRIQIGLEDPEGPSSMGKRLYPSSVAGYAMDPAGRTLFTVPAQGDELRAWDLTGSAPPQGLKWPGTTSFKILVCMSDGRIAFIHRGGQGRQEPWFVTITHTSHLESRWAPVKQR